MHDLIQEMAWEIVRRESHKEPGRRSRLCHQNDIFYVFKNNTGTKEVEVVVLRLTELEKANWNCKAFSKMINLRLLEFDNLIISSGPKSLPNSLRILKWSWYPSKFLLPSFRPELLAELSLTHSKLVQLWENARVHLPKLKKMDLSFSKNLTSTPDFTSILNLEELIFVNCTNLVEVHPSIADLKKLKICDFRDCKSLTILPSEVQMESLKLFSLYGCSKVKKVPEFLGQMNNLSYLFLGWTGIEKIPLSIKRLIGLIYLDLSDCKSLSCLPSAICNLKSLKDLYLSRCSKLDKLPENLGEMESLETLELMGNNIREPPHSLISLKNLEYLSFRGPNPMGLVLTSLHGLCSLVILDLSDCNLFIVPDTIGCLWSLANLDLSKNNFVSLPASISRLSNLQRLILEGCKMFQQFPDLPSSGILSHVNTQDCTSLKMLSDPPILGRDIQMRDFALDAGNCFGLVDDEGCSTIILLMLRRCLQGIPRSIDRFQITTPGRKIPNWFIPSELKEDSFIVELPPPSCRELMGIAFCVLFEDQENTAALSEFSYFGIDGYLEVFCVTSRYTHKIGHLGSDHLWVSYVSCPKWNPKCSEIKILIETYYAHNNGHRQTCSIVKSCGFRLVYEKDVEELNQMVNQPISSTSPYKAMDVTYCEQCDKGASLKRTREYCDEIEESLCQSLKEDKLS